jgi:hypothetical protein
MAKTRIDQRMLSFSGHSAHGLHDGAGFGPLVKGGYGIDILMNYHIVKAHFILKGADLIAFWGRKRRNRL